MWITFDGQDYKQICEREDGQKLFLSEEGDLIDSIHDLRKTSLSTATEDQLVKAGELNYIYAGTSTLSDFLNENGTLKDAQELMGVLLPTLKQLWIEGKLS